MSKLFVELFVLAGGELDICILDFGRLASIVAIVLRTTGHSSTKTVNRNI